MDLVLTTFLNPSGISTVGQQYFRAFSDFGLNVIPVWCAPPEEQNLKYLNQEIVEQMVHASRALQDADPIQFHTGVSHDIKILKYRTALFSSIVLEGTKLNSDHIRVCRVSDAILSPSYFCRGICQRNGVPANKLFYLPYPLDKNVWNPNVLPQKINTNSRFKFLYMNTLYERKGWDILLKAWWSEFSADDGVELIIKSYKEDDRKIPAEIKIKKLAEELGINPEFKAPITIIDEVWNEADLPGLMKSCDCYVSPHRSEGFGMNIWHAMALGIPVIATEYGGNLDFCKNNTSFLIKTQEMVKPSQQEINIFPHLEGSQWAEPSLESTARLMREVYENREEANKRAMVGAHYVANQYSDSRIMMEFEIIVKKLRPKAWERLLTNKNLKSICKQPSPRFENKPLTFVEI